ncbi:MAG: hypothetical protein K6T26_00555 [Alicyclobacillus sp.]|nr:hypothetical protein [Alicyclobacillus sp.]
MAQTNRRKVRLQQLIRNMVREELQQLWSLEKGSGHHKSGGHKHKKNEKNEHKSGGNKHKSNGHKSGGNKHKSNGHKSGGHKHKSNGHKH